MNAPKRVRFYLQGAMTPKNAAGPFRFAARMAEVLESSGFVVDYARMRDAQEGFDGYSVFRMKEPFAERSVTFRDAYHASFYRIESTNRRWDWSVANAAFRPSKVNNRRADNFFNDWRQRMFGSAAADARKAGTIFVPLQGKLFAHRSFQTRSPLTMLRETLKHAEGRKVDVTLHPKERYDLEELEALSEVLSTTENASLSERPMTALLQDCDYVVAQNSSVAFMANFFRKPTVLYGKIDFHHIALNVADLGAEEAFRLAPDHAPKFAKYVWWFWQQNAINLRKTAADQQIVDRLRALGWPV